MLRRIGVAVSVLVAVAAVAALVVVEPVQGAKPPANVPLRATFRSAVDAGQTGADYYVDKILNDSKGAYVTNARLGTSVYFTGDNGELVFTVDHHSSRNVRVIFPYIGNDTSSDYSWLPDTAGLYSGLLPYEPIDFFKFRTFNSNGFGEIRLNFTNLKHGDVKQTRLWTTFCTTLRHYFFMNYSKDVGTISGLVQVSAYADTADPVVGVSPATRWVIEPLPGTGDVANIFKHPETGDDSVNYPFGSFPMPFQLTLTKQ